VALNCPNIEAKDFQGYLRDTEGRLPLDRGFHIYEYGRRIESIFIFDRRKFILSSKPPVPLPITVWRPFLFIYVENFAKEEAVVREHLAFAPPVSKHVSFTSSSYGSSLETVASILFPVESAALSADDHVEHAITRLKDLSDVLPTPKAANILPTVASQRPTRSSDAADNAAGLEDSRGEGDRPERQEAIATASKGLAKTTDEGDHSSLMIEQWVLSVALEDSSLVDAYQACQPACFHRKLTTNSSCISQTAAQSSRASSCRTMTPTRRLR